MAEDTNYWQRFARKRYNRRRLIQMGAIGAGGLAAAAAVGCEGDDDDATETATEAVGEEPGEETQEEPGEETQVEGPPEGVSEVLHDYRTRFNYRNLANAPGQSDEPVSGGTLNFSTYAGVTGWNLTGPEGDTLASFAPNHFNGLLAFAQSDFNNAHNLYEDIQGDLAESFEQVDETTFTFKLHQGVKFHDIAPVNGRELVAEDVAYAAEVFSGKQDPTLGFAQQPIFSGVESVETPDDYTVTFKFSEPAAYFINSLTYPVSLIFAREAFEEGPEAFNATPIGTGPFILDTFDPPNVYRATRNPEYFRRDPHSGLQLPFIDGFEAPMLLGNDPAEEAGFRAGDLHVIWSHRKTNFDAMFEAFDDNVGQVTTPPPGYQPFMTLKLDKEPFTDERVRRALQMLINQQALVDGPAEGLADFGYAQDFSFFGREYPWSATDLAAMGANQYNPEEARSLLEAAGNPFEGRPLKMLWPILDGLQHEVFTLVADFWRQGGIEVETDEVPAAELSRWSTALFGRQWGDLDVIGQGFAGPGTDPDQYSYGALNSASARNVFYVDDPELDDLTARQRSIFDVDARRDVLLQIAERDLAQAFRIWAILPYKLSVRRGFVYNFVDTIHAWAGIGWGTKGNEVTWLNQ
ncbi:MAG: ABC transporter substrate-binding protein [Dehalococcoidia bacterium]